MVQRYGAAAAPGHVIPSLSATRLFVEAEPTGAAVTRMRLAIHDGW